MLGPETIRHRLTVPGDDPLVISPQPAKAELAKGDNASIDLRLGTWFNAFRPGRTALLKIERKGSSQQIPEAQLAKLHYVPLGETYVLHPGQFVLGVTLQWIRMPADLGAYVIGKSSWGRRGLVIATATVVHPGFTGCLTLELANVGEIPIELRPGIRICQLCFHEIVRRPGSGDVGAPVSSFIGQRRPMVGHVVMDEIAEDLSGPMQTQE